MHKSFFNVCAIFEPVGFFQCSMFVSFWTCHSLTLSFLKLDKCCAPFRVPLFCNYEFPQECVCICVSTSVAVFNVTMRFLFPSKCYEGNTAPNWNFSLNTTFPVQRAIGAPTTCSELEPYLLSKLRIQLAWNESLFGTKLRDWFKLCPLKVILLYTSQNRNNKKKHV